MSTRPGCYEPPRWGDWRRGWDSNSSDKCLNWRHPSLQRPPSSPRNAPQRRLTQKPNTYQLSSTAALSIEPTVLVQVLLLFGEQVANQISVVSPYVIEPTSLFSRTLCSESDLWPCAGSAGYCSVGCRWDVAVGQLRASGLGSCRSAPYSRYGLSTPSIHFMNARTRRDRLLRWATTKDIGRAPRRKSGKISTSAPLSK